MSEVVGKRGRKLKYYGKDEALEAVERNRKAALERARLIVQHNETITVPLAQRLQELFPNSKVKPVQTGITLQITMLDLPVLENFLKL
jgi:hypothetical protein